MTDKIGTAFIRNTKSKLNEISSFIKQSFAIILKRVYTEIMEILTKSALETENAGYNYAKTLNKGDVVLLNGEMGAGKTVFTKGIARYLNVTETVTSPTYAYMNDYDGVLYHYDCYRLQSGEDAEALGLTDYFYAGGISVIEWSENIKDVLPKNCKTVEIIKTENGRKIIL